MKAIICTLIILLTFSCGNILNDAENTDTAETDPAADNGTQPGNETGEAEEIPGETVVPLDIVFVLDTSGSMQADDLQ